MKKLVALSLALVMFLACALASAEQYVLNGISMDIPSEWSVLSQEENAIGAMKGTELLFIVTMDLNSNPDFEAVAPMIRLLDSETFLTLMASGFGETIEMEPVATLPSGLSALYCVLDMSNYAEEGALFGTCPAFVTMNGDIVMMAYVSALGREVSAETKAEFHAITSTATPVN